MTAENKTRYRPNWRPYACGGLVLVLAIGLWLGGRANERRRVRADTQAYAASIGEMIKGDANSTSLAAIRRMGKRWTAQKAMSQDIWQYDAQQYIADMPFFIAIEWVDREGVVRWVEPLEGNETALGLQLNFEGHRHDGLVRANEQGDVQITRVVELVQGGMGILAFYPLEVDAQDNGYMLSVIRPDRWISNILRDTNDQFDVQILDGDMALFERIHEPGTGAPGPQERLTIEIGGVPWVVQVAPNTRYYAQRPSLPLIGLAFGIVLSVLIGGLVHLAQLSRHRAGILEISESRYRAAAESLSSVIWLSDPTGRFNSPQRSWEQFTGQPWEEHRDSGWIKMISPDTKEQLGVAWEKAVRERTRYYCVAKCWSAHEQAYRWFEVAAEPLLTPDGEVREWIGMIIDIHDRYIAEEALQQHERELQSKNNELEQFVYTASHDLKSPLLTIMGFLKCIKEDFANGATDEIDSHADRIMFAAKSMKQNIDELLELSRIGRVTNDYQFVDVAEMLEKILLQLDSQIRGRQVDIQTFLEVDRVYADPIRFEQVLLNYLQNALRYGLDGDRGTITIGTSAEGDTTKLWVRDEGPGIDPAYHEKIFTLFERLSRDKDGSGVGLAIVRRIAEVHGGRAWVESAPGQGSTFFAGFAHQPSTITSVY